MTFETFVVGPANRLAAAAARRAADSPGTSYNPLFIYSPSGLGKSHILTAIAHHASKVHPEATVVYQTMEGYLDELAEALESGERDRLKEQYAGLDIFLLDDVQFLSGQPEAQELLLRTLDTLSVSGSQIALASDRPPAEIDALDDRLLSRFSGGLIVDIAQPEFETRVAIVRRKAEERGMDLEDGVAEAVARHPFKNVRELGGALNRVFAVQDLEERRVTSDEIPDLLGLAKEPSGEEGGGDEFGTFVDELSVDLATTVNEQEAPWRVLLRETAQEAEEKGFRTGRLRRLLERDEEPGDVEEVVEGFREDLDRLREIGQE
ncbi:MAG: DnaA/Hda family protein, partial [Longimicrobiales bacterium]|nr:DnaA/Hda family protein [Longimicrobiales bacterium]